MAYTFKKSQRLCGNSLTDLLFSKGDRSIASFPIRLVWLLIPLDRQLALQAPVQILISASKRHFKHAVDRNRIKRQVRQYYRTHQHEIETKVSGMNSRLLLAFLFTDCHLWTSDQLSKKLDAVMAKLMERIDSGNFNVK